VGFTRETILKALNCIEVNGLLTREIMETVGAERWCRVGIHAHHPVVPQGTQPSQGGDKRRRWMVGHRPTLLHGAVAQNHCQIGAAH